MADILDDARAMLAERIRTPGAKPSRRLALIERLADEVERLRTELGSEHAEWLENQEDLADLEASNNWPLARKQLQAHRSEIRRLRKVLRAVRGTATAWASASGVAWVWNEAGRRILDHLKEDDRR